MGREKKCFLKFLSLILVVSIALPAYALDEITVTAERIEANLQEVPMAVTALSAADLETNNITSTMDLTKAVPGMVYRKNTGTASASNVYIRGFGDDESRLTDPTTGLYIDGVYVGRPYGSLMELVDAGSVEVLRGPQGTLYGRNTIAGAIKINSRERGETGGKVALTFGNDGHKKFKGHADIAISDSTGVSISAMSEESDGYINAGAFGKQGGKDLDAMRIAFDHEFGNGWEMILSYDNTADDSDPTPATTRPTYNTAANSSFNYVDETDSEGLTFRLSGDLGGWNTSLIYGSRSIENYLDSHISFRYTQIMDQEQDSVEVSVNRDFGKLNLTAGFFWMEETFDFEYDFGRFGYGASFDQKTDQTAFFLNTKTQVTDQLTLTAGVRSMSEDKDLIVSRTNTLGVGPAYVIGPAGGAGVYKLDFDREDYKVALDYKINDNLMAYVSNSTGSRTGGWSPDTLTPVDEEELETTELGIRSTLGNHRINATYFVSVLDGFQTGISSGGGFGRSNADEAEFEGFEIEFAGNITDNLSYYAFLTTLDAEYTELTVAQAQGFLGSTNAARQAACPAAGALNQNPGVWQQCAYNLKVKGAPEMTWSVGLKYVAGDFTFDVQGYGADETFALTGNPRYAMTDKYDKYDLSVTYEPEGSSYAVKLFGKNVTDQHEVANGTGGLVYMYDPRSYGLTVSAKF